MQGRHSNVIEGSTPPADTIQAFCRHLGELCDVLASPYDAEALARAAANQDLQGTNCNVLLHNALYNWLGERVELSLGDDDKPEEAGRRAREAALAKIQKEDMLSEFIQAVVSTCANTDTALEVPRGKQSLMFDLRGPIDLLGPEEVDSLLSELTTSDSPITALEALSSDVHLLEDLCFGPTWPQLCDALGRLVCLPAAAAATAARGGHNPGEPAQQLVALPRQQQLLLTVLQELVSSSAVSSPPHAAELLDALAPYLTALVLRLTLPSGDDGGTETSAPSLLAAAAALDSFAVGLTRVAHQLLAGLVTEYHILPTSCAALAARAVCDVIRAGLARGAPAPTPVPAAAAGMRKEDPVVVDLSALDLLVLLDPELRWWQRLCAATHATQPVAHAAAATQLAAALEAALQAWVAATAAAASSSSSSGSHMGTVAQCGGVARSGGRSSTHLVACTALLGGLARANNLALLAVEPRDGGGVGGNASGSSPQKSPPMDPAAAAAATQNQLLRLQRMLGYLVNCFCVALDKPWLLQSNGRPPAAAATVAAAVGAANTTSGGTVFLLLASDVLSVAAANGALSLLTLTGASTGSSAAMGSAGGSGLVPLLQTMLRAAATTACATIPIATAATGVVQGSSSAAFATASSQAETWLGAAARILGAAADYAALTAAGTGSTSAAGTGAAVMPSRDPQGQSATAEAMCGLLRHMAGRVRGCASASASAAPRWTVQVVRAAVQLVASWPPVAASLNDFYDTLHAVLASRAAVAAGGRSGLVSQAQQSASSTHAAVCRSASGGGSGGRGSSSGHGTGSGSVPRFALLDLLDGGGASAAVASGHVRHGDSKDAAFVPPPILDDLELLAAETVISYCRTDFEGSGGAATVAVNDAEGRYASALPVVWSPPLRLQLPAGLQRQVFLECAARWLCAEYDSAGAAAPGGGSGRSVSRTFSVKLTAAKRRVAHKAEALACCCPAGQQALLAAVLLASGKPIPIIATTNTAGFARRVLVDVTAVLCSGEYESPHLEPLPYADSLAGLSAILADVLCWPGLLQLPQEEDGGRGKSEGAKEGKGGENTAAATAPSPGGVLPSIQSQHRKEVLALLQELVTWLDPRGREGKALPPDDAAAVSLRAFLALVTVDPTAGAALERDTNIRWYLQSLCGTLPEVEDQEGATSRSPPAAAAVCGDALRSARQQQMPQLPQPPQSDMVLDMARKVLLAITRSATVQ
ncbi:hypothetical protein VOLCADRAFT_94567 [Volvox carteri f. nagariensis]|uniref:Uncharacterized protein n=1 Tax=Volvox carteri f. nagariensis TaxID=3068 RepID=D8U542_VOLCA|nr:uncharacterized protein VOLCADRAFT_94567 [Volvox carteri f. nagariensis]EFJ45154.1 hypothetical protein VOLCADRAFT_94567 [Volvox carteri f. nagariensis]|eukprot:XP_002953830.1 hypothetical protein VOLCADRAFT_94567 [Volvox carteri f. nagariensis]